MGYALLIKELPNFLSDGIQPIINSLLSRQVDGIIWAVPEVGDNRDWLQDRLTVLKVPMIFLTMQSRSGLSIVSINNYFGGRMATEHLLKQGYRRIGHISGPIDWWEARQRKEGWQDALLEAGISRSEKHWVQGNWSSASGDQAIHQLMSQYPEMNAIFVANDQMALSVLQFACQMGLQVPQDLAVVGFDGIPEAAYFWPPLTTIYQDQNTLGCTAVKELVRIVELTEEESATEPKTILFQPELIIRESSIRE